MSDDRTLELSRSDVAELIGYLDYAVGGMSESCASTSEFDELSEMRDRLSLFLYGAVGEATVRMPRRSDDRHAGVGDWAYAITTPTSLPVLDLIRAEHLGQERNILWGWSRTEEAK